MHAAERGLESVVELLLEEGARPEVENFRHWTALSYAAEHGHGAIVETLLDAKAGPESFADDIAVLLAKDNGHEAIVQMLHAAGVQC